MHKWEMRPDKCICLGGYCYRRFHCNRKARKESEPPPLKRRANKQEHEFVFHYSAKPNDLRFWERVWHPKEG